MRMFIFAWLVCTGFKVWFPHLRLHQSVGMASWQLFQSLTRHCHSKITGRTLLAFRNLSLEHGADRIIVVTPCLYVHVTFSVAYQIYQKRSTGVPATNARRTHQCSSLFFHPCSHHHPFPSFLQGSSNSKEIASKSSSSSKFFGSNRATAAPCLRKTLAVPDAIDRIHGFHQKWWVGMGFLGGFLLDSWWSKWPFQKKILLLKLSLSEIVEVKKPLIVEWWSLLVSLQFGHSMKTVLNHAVLTVLNF